MPSLECELASRESIFHIIEPLDLTKELIVLPLIYDYPFLFVSNGVLHEAINIILFLNEILLVVLLIFNYVGLLHQLVLRHKLLLEFLEKKIILILKCLDVFISISKWNFFFDHCKIGIPSDTHLLVFDVFPISGNVRSGSLLDNFPSS